MMDASTSRLYLKAVVNSDLLGRVVVYSDMDFRGGEEFSYLPRLRSAYVQFKGLTIGRDVSTFCDLEAAPTTIDFQGPNAYNFTFNEMIRYEYHARSGLSFGIAAERPVVNATYGENFSAIMQRVPDGIAYLQYKFGRERVSHLRISGVIRDMYLHNNLTGENTTQLGWGVQFSGHLGVTRWVDLYMNGTYGQGITPYIQDLTGSPYDFTYNPENPTQLQTPSMWGWQAAAQVNIMPNRFWVAAGYSEVGLDKSDGYISEKQYKKGSYLFANAFYKLTPNLTFALEYLHGTRRDASDILNSANRLSIMAQYNF
jgi:predicted porin